ALGVVGEVPDLVDLAALVVGPAVLGCDPQELAPVGGVPAVPDDGGRVGGATLVAPGLDVDRSAAGGVRGARRGGRRRACLGRPPRAAVERPVGLAAADVGGVAPLSRAVAADVPAVLRCLVGELLAVEELDLQLDRAQRAGQEDLLAELGTRSVPCLRGVGFQVEAGVRRELAPLALADLL